MEVSASESVESNGREIAYIHYGTGRPVSSVTIDGRLEETTIEVEDAATIGSIAAGTPRRRS